MSRTLVQRMRDWRWWGEQVAHFLVPFAFVWFALWIHDWQFGISGTHARVILSGVATLAGGLRETIQNHGDADGSLGDSIVDQTAWALGAIIPAICYSSGAS